MNSNKKFFTALTALVFTLLLSVFCMTVFAETDDSYETEDNELSETLDVEAPVVSGCDLRKDDLKMVTIKTTNFKMLLPTGTAKDMLGGTGVNCDLVTIESTKKEIENSKLGDMGYSRSTLIGNNIFLYFNTNKDNYCQVYAGMVQLNPLDAYYGDYASLTDEQKAEVIADKTGGDGSSSSGKFEKINGRTYLIVSSSEIDETTGNQYVTYGLYTVIDNYEYIIQVDALNPNEEDNQTINNMLNSIKIGGISKPLSVLEIALIVCGAILLIGILFAVFTIYRLGSYVKAGVVPKSVFGFDVPYVAPAEDDSDDDDSDDNQDFGDDGTDFNSQYPSDAVSPISSNGFEKDESILG
jgi:hypothetical protein